MDKETDGPSYQVTDESTRRFEGRQITGFHLKKSDGVDDNALGMENLQPRCKEKQHYCMAMRPTKQNFGATCEIVMLTQSYGKALRPNENARSKRTTCHGEGMPRFG